MPRHIEFAHIRARHPDPSHMDSSSVVEGTTQSKPLDSMYCMTQHPMDQPTPEQLQEHSDSNAKFLKEIHCRYLAYNEEDEDQDNWLFRGEDEDYSDAA